MPVESTQILEISLKALFWKTCSEVILGDVTMMMMMATSTVMTVVTLY